MSALSGVVDWVFGAGSSDSVISSINDYTGINLDFGLSSTTPSPTDPSPDSKKSSFFTPANIIGGLEVYSKIAGQQDSKDASQKLLDAKVAESALEFERQKELLALKASLGGGGGGGGGGDAAAIANAQMAFEAKRTKYLGVQEAMKNAMEARGKSSGNIIEAIRNLTEAAQRPLTR